MIGFTPAFSISADGIDVTGGINDRLVEMTVTLHEGGSADEVRLVLDDRDFALRPPRKGAMLVVMLGYKETGLALMGRFTVRSRRRRFDKGGGRVMEIAGKSADMGKEAKKPRTEEHKKTTIGGLVGKIAGRNGLGAKVGRLGSKKIEWEPQGEESDMHLLTRLAREDDAVCAWANGMIMYLARDELPVTRPLLLTDFIDCTVEDDDRNQHRRATAHHHRQKEVDREPETDDSGDTGDGTEDAPEFMLRHTYPTKERAKAAAKGAMSRLDRTEKSLSGTLTGDPAIMAGMIAPVAIGAELYDGLYGLKTVTHHLVKGGGYTTKIASHKGKGGKGAAGGAGGGRR